MVEAFVSFIRNIAVFLIFYAFIEMILPNSNFKKYINMCLGLIMIIVILKPIAQIVANGGNIFQFQSISANLQQKINSNEDYEKLQQSLVMQNYKLQLADQINKLVTQKVGVSIIKNSIEVIEDKNSTAYGQITNIELQVQKALDVKNMDKSTEVSEDEIILVKKIIYDFYNTPMVNIHVIVS